MLRILWTKLRTIWTKIVKNPPKHFEGQGDWSLRANGETYRDRSNESIILTKRLIKCSASVTGIAGCRGSGKSSLALRVLDNCAKKGAFTQLIHSPTGYDPREFLVSVFQRLCESVVTRIDRQFGQVNSLYARGEAERSRLVRISLLLIFGAVVPLVAAIFYGYYQMYQESSQERLQELATVGSSYRKQLADRENDLARQIDQLLPQSLARNNEILRNLMSERSWVKKELEMLDSEPIIDTIGDTFLIFMLVLAAYIILTVLLRHLMSIRGRIVRARRFSRETGLRQLALEISEHLKFQTTLSTSTEKAVSLAKLTATRTAGKSLMARPLSLPSLTDQCALFLKRIGEVYAGRVVICLDELDKIENPRNLDNLLRGIKGVLGQPNTHFILTVSEDALAEFTKQRRLDTGMLESAFEDIVLLERIDLKVADYVVELMYPESNRGDADGTIHMSTKLLWLFGGAIPREVKRNARVCLEAGLRPKMAPDTGNLEHAFPITY